MRQKAMQLIQYVPHAAVLFKFKNIILDGCNRFRLRPFFFSVHCQQNFNLPRKCVAKMPKNRTDDHRCIVLLYSHKTKQIVHGF